MKHAPKTRTLLPRSTGIALLALVLTLPACSTEESGIDARTESSRSSSPDDSDDDRANEPPDFTPAQPDAQSFGALPCSQSREDLELPEADGDFVVEIGVPDAETESAYFPFTSDCIVPIAGVGQAGLLARLAVRTTADLSEALVELRITNPADTERIPGVNNDAETLRALGCADDGYCYAVPIRVEITHLNRLPELEGTLVALDAHVTDPDSDDFGTAHAWGVFERRR